MSLRLKVLSALRNTLTVRLILFWEEKIKFYVTILRYVKRAYDFE